MAFQHLRSSTASKRPTPAAMSDAQLAINTNTASPGLFFKDSAGALIKVGPVHVGSAAPNASPASGGQTGNTVGEQWLDTSGTNPVFKIWDGSAWQSEAGEFVNTSGDLMTGALGIIAGTNSAPGLYFSGDTNTGIYSPGANQLAISTNGTGRLFVDDNGRIGVGTDNPATSIHVSATTAGIRVQDSDETNSYSTFQQAGTSLYIDSRNDTAGASIIFRQFNGTSNSEALLITQTGQLSHIGGGSTGSPAVGFNGSAPSNSLVIDSTGKVGLGTSSPDELLHIQGDTAEFKGTNTNPIANTLGTEQVFKFGIEGQKNNVYGPAGSIVFRQDGSTWSSVDANFKPTRIEFCTQDGTASDTSETPRLVIDKDGNVGVGTTSPDAKLEVVNDSTGSTELIRARIQGQTNNPMLRVFADEANQTVTLDTSGSVAGTELVFKEGGSEAMRIDSSGRLLVGTSSGRSISQSATANLQLEGTSWATTGISLTTNSDDAFGSRLIFGKSRSTAVGGSTVVQSGDFLGGIRFAGADGTDIQTIAAEITSQVDGTPGANDMPGRLVFSTNPGSPATGPTERMRITSSGDVKIGAADNIVFQQSGIAACTLANSGGNLLTTDATNAAFNGTLLRLRTTVAAGTSCLYVYATANNALTLSVTNNGDIKNLNNSYGSVSDIKLKENIVDANPQWDDIKALQVRNYNFKEGQTHTQIGLVAQEVELVSPGLVSESPDRDEDGNDLGTVTKSVNYSVLYMKAVKALQEAMERIETLEQRLNNAGIN